MPPIFTAESVSSMALHCHADHLHPSCSNTHSHFLTHKPRHDVGAWGGECNCGEGGRWWWMATVQELNSNTQLQDKKNSKWRSSSLTSCWLPFKLIRYFWTYPYHLSSSTPLIPHPSWPSSDIHTDMQCLLSSTITSSENASVTPFLSHTVQYYPCFLLHFTKQTNKPKHRQSTQTTFSVKVEWIALLINSFIKK